MAPQYADGLRWARLLRCCQRELVAEHEHVVVGTRKSSDVDYFHWVNTPLGNHKSSIQYTYHGFKFDKYAVRYLGELCGKSDRNDFKADVLASDGVVHIIDTVIIPN